MRDPVCGMTVGATALTAHSHPEYRFCSTHCLEAFTTNPDQYLEQEAEDATEEEANQAPGHVDASGSEATNNQAMRRGDKETENDPAHS